MLSSKLWNHCLVRTFTRSVVRKNVDKSKVPETTSSPTAKTTSPTTSTTQGQPVVDVQDIASEVIPTKWEKRFLIWCKKYKTSEDIPAKVSIVTLNAVRSKLRVQVATLLMVLVLLGCFIITRVGRAKASRGETLTSLEKQRERRLQEGRIAVLRDAPK